MTMQAPALVFSTIFVPSEADVDRLIARAEDHVLGVEFLVGGALDAVAATFDVHAFTVEAARDRLNA